MDLVTERRIPLPAYLSLVCNTSRILSEMLRTHKVISPFDLPNRTPNGKLTNVGDATLSRAIVLATTWIIPTIHSIEKDFNLRVKGQDEQEELDRPYSTSQWHTDVWAGEPANSYALIIPLIGDTDTAGLECGICPKVPLREFPSYKLGLAATGPIELYSRRFKPGHAYILAPNCLHRTVRSTNSFRLSIDLRFTTEKPLPATRAAKYIPFQDWIK